VLYQLRILLFLFRIRLFSFEFIIRSSNSVIRFALPGWPGASNKLSNMADWEVVQNRLGVWTNAILQQVDSVNFNRH